MNLTDVENLAELAKLELSQEEKEQILKDMEGILGYVKQIEEVKIAEVSPDYSVHNVWREDEVIQKDFSQDSIKEQFPDSQDGFLKVKKIL
ncbi:Asp-tRNA(Asn)/Glu-tRNA(Gln) amidotransferase subunit GatC [Candidatus Nomurabacteria bacterium]|nr:Asp-tRNA(Asn)/Glu-tRNA(Gln) amidotransferase subunit GatC [Candidatus Nomurabacteria bacterium]